MKLPANAQIKKRNSEIFQPEIYLFTNTVILTGLPQENTSRGSEAFSP